MPKITALLFLLLIGTGQLDMCQAGLYKQRRHRKNDKKTAIPTTTIDGMVDLKQQQQQQQQQTTTTTTATTTT